MKRAFVVRLGLGTNPIQSRFEGFVEEVDTGKQLRFRSSAQLLDFLGKRFEALAESESGGQKPPGRT